MTRLKLADLTDEKPVRLSVDLSARLHRDLVAYAIAVNGGDTQGAPSPEKLVGPMIERFIATDRSFTKTRRTGQPG